jgi:hypothetical protein
LLRLAKVVVVPSAMVPGWGVRAEWVVKVTVVLGLVGLDSAMVSVVLASGDLDSAMVSVVLASGDLDSAMVPEWVTKVVVDAADADRGQQLTHLPTPIRTEYQPTCTTLNTTTSCF